MSRLHRLWQFLTRPAPHTREPERRLNAQLIQRIIISLTPLGLLASTWSIWFFPDHRPWLQSDFLVTLGGSLFWGIAFFLARAGRLEAAVLLAAAAAMTVSFTTAVLNHFWLSLSYLILPLLLVSMVLSIRATVSMVLVALAGILVASAIVSEVQFFRILFAPFCFVALTSLLIILATRHRQRQEQLRRAALSDSEARYRSLFEMAFEGIASHHGGTLLDVNAGFARIFEETMDGMRQRNIQEWVDPDSRDRLLEALQAGNSQSIEVMARTSSGSSVALELLSRNPLGDEQILAVRNITERRAAEQDQLQAQRLEGVGLLAGGLAHDFNNLLTGILGMNSIVLSELQRGSPAYQNIETAMKYAEQAAELTNQLLAYAGRKKINRTTLDLNQWLLDNRSLFESMVPLKGWLRLELARGLSAVEVDRAQIQQVLMNLVINAAEAIESFSGTVHLKTSCVVLGAADWDRFVGATPPAKGPYVCLEVRDTGPGIPPENLSRIFEPFYTTKPTGHGLGLSAAIGIVHSHGGEIQVQTGTGGTTFRVYLPVARSLPPPAAPPAPAAARYGTVLVVDDEPAVRQTTERMLSFAGFHALVAADGQEGLDLFKQHTDEVSAVILDVKMPGMSGEIAFHALRKITPCLPIILSSGFHELEFVEQAVAEDRVEFLPKPFSMQGVVEALDRVLDPAPATRSQSPADP